jgi:hypothetical protein
MNQNMKKHLLKLGIALTLAVVGISTTSFGEKQFNQIASPTEEVLDCHYGQCKATAKSTGNRCRHCVSNEGDSYCWQHK